MSFRGSIDIDDERGGLLGELTVGFDALMHRADELVAANAQLEKRLHAMQMEYLTPNHTSSASSTAENSERRPSIPSDWRQDPTIGKGIQAWKLLKIATVPAVPLRNGQRNHVDSATRTGSTAPAVPVISPLELDFTTQGPKGNLKCPFSKRGLGKCGNKPETLELYHVVPPLAALAQVAPDPIAREFHVEVQDQLPPSEDVAPKCPIRYLDQHSPEELAKYVENHKHEIPRSHEVCVKRYQANEASIRSLDAKYGSLVKMIQGLGEKHKPMLPTSAEGDGEEEPVLDAKSMEKVQKWAKDLPDGEAPAALDDESADGSEIRTGHFERPLDEVRLGESPSRPWGIRVPDLDGRPHGSEVPNDTKLSRPSSVAPPANAPNHELDVPKTRGKCPFDHAAMPHLAPTSVPKADMPPRSPEPSHPAKQALSGALQGGKIGNGPPQVVFSGPVFFGYSAEEAAALMSAIPGWAPSMTHD